MEKEEWIRVRVSSDLKERILKYVAENDYENESVLIREAIVEKIDPQPDKRREQLKRELLEIIREEPNILNPGFRHIRVVSDENGRNQSE